MRDLFLFEKGTSKPRKQNFQIILLIKNNHASFKVAVKLLCECYL